MRLRKYNSEKELLIIISFIKLLTDLAKQKIQFTTLDNIFEYGWNSVTLSAVDSTPKYIDGFHQQ